LDYVGAGGSLAQAKKVDLDAVPQIGGQSIYEYDLEAAVDKPWRMPGTHGVKFLVSVGVDQHMQTHTHTHTHNF